MNHDIYRINSSGVVWRRNNGKTVILLMREGKYFALNGTASAVWDLLHEGKGTIDDLASALSNTYDTDEEIAKADVTELLSELVSEKLIVLTSANNRGR